MEPRDIRQLISEVDEHRNQQGLQPMSDQDWLRFSEFLERRVHAVEESAAEPVCYQITEDEWNEECAREVASRVHRPGSDCEYCG